MKKKNVLIIAGFDPTCGAGVVADALTVATFNTSPLVVITADTVQDGNKVFATTPVKPKVFRMQLDSIARKFRIDAVKIGMLGSEAITKETFSFLKKNKISNIVLDPVLYSSSGFPLYEEKKRTELKKLFTISRIITPNTNEASILSGIKIKNLEDVRIAAKSLYTLGVRNVLIKGGHLKGSPIDTLYDGKRFYYFKGNRIKGTIHGSGCALSSAITAELAKGKSINTAIRSAKRYVAGLIAKKD